MNTQGITTLTFDCYGTLINWEQGILDFFQPILQRRGQGKKVNEILETFAKFEHLRQRRQPTLIYPEILEAVYSDMFEHWGIQTDDSEALAFGQTIKDWPPFPDSSESLRRLKQKYRLVILSNVDNHNFSFTNAKLGVPFDAIFTAEDIGSYKPDPRNFEYMIRRLTDSRISKDEILHVAQSRFHDIEPAENAGLKTVWVDRGQNQGGSGATPATSFIVRTKVANMAELTDLLLRDS